jgi:hypothetical protein
MEILMFCTLRLFILFVLSTSLFASESIGVIKKLRGEATVTRNNSQLKLSLSGEIFEKDKISTKASSFVKVLFKDQTSIIIGPNSEMEITSFSKTKSSLYKFVRGKFRSKVSKKTNKENKVTFQTDLASLAIRGTEFLTNAYLVKGKGVTDTALLEGSIQTSIKNNSAFMLEQGQAFNTSKLAMNKGVTKLDSSYIESLIKNENEFLPNIQNPDGSFNNLNEMFKNATSKSISPTSSGAAIATTVGIGAAATATVINNKNANSTAAPVTKKKKQKKELDLKTLPWSIRDAILRRDDLKAENECFYWFFKRLPGGGEEELFRRERDCDEFEYDL